jgi:hypothetical protein
MAWKSHADLIAGTKAAALKARRYTNQRHKKQRQ